MDSDGLPIVGPNVDFTKVGPINHKRTLAFLNHFITHSVRFLNRFSCVCEEKLAELSYKIQQIEIMMSILEAKLASIPGLEDVTVSTPPAASSQAGDTAGNASAVGAAPPPPPPVAAGAPQSAAEGPPALPADEPAPEPEKPTMTVSKDPRYAKYFQMVKVGVPPQAIAPKMIIEGLDPSLLENPDAPVPEGSRPPPMQSDSDDEMSSTSSFSDEE
ncbi:WASH complex subunit 3-like [Montipora capricornis]|uniref:WASH complex subunit 3-like n=1 Tax=Montipora capricornis TaxID=246305 RepID=UPI0035F12F9A